MQLSRNKSVVSLDRLLEVLMKLYRYFQSIDRKYTLQQTVANAQYYHSILTAEIKRLNGTRTIVVHADGGVGKQALEELLQAPDWDYQNNCWYILTQELCPIGFASSKSLHCPAFGYRFGFNSSHVSALLPVYRQGLR